MKRKTLLTTLIMFAAIGTGTAMALNVSGIIARLPIFGNLGPVHSAPPTAPPANAAITQYGTRISVTIVRCRPALVRAGGSATCTASVIGLGRATPTGTVTFSNGATCTLHAARGRAAECSVTVTPTHPLVTFVRAVYSGDAVYRGSSGLAVVAVLFSHRRFL